VVLDKPKFVTALQLAAAVHLGVTIGIIVKLIPVVIAGVVLSRRT
jgi:hypothetical protein